MENVKKWFCCFLSDYGNYHEDKGISDENSLYEGKQHVYEDNGTKGRICVVM